MAIYCTKKLLDFTSESKQQIDWEQELVFLLMASYRLGLSLMNFTEMHFKCLRAFGIEQKGSERVSSKNEK